MKTRAHEIQKKSRSQQSATNISTQLQSRPFAVQTQSSPESEEEHSPDRGDRVEPLSHNLSEIAIVPSATHTAPIQTKLTVGPPNDQYEQEADRVAAQVVNQISNANSASATQRKPIQRQSPRPGMGEEETKGPIPGAAEEDEIQPKSLVQRQSPRPGMGEEETKGPIPGASEEDEIQPKSLVQRRTNAKGTADENIEQSIEQTRGSGQPLEDNVRAPMENAFGANFGGVRIHNNAQSDNLNKSLQARAFTTGQDIHFSQGAYNPNSKSGQELLAHELTHVVQQSGGALQTKGEEGAKVSRKK
ncbi:DUF4157 domain-containing protein [Oxynema sp. CENA135]|uniref:eCIS core domain-containing protein n=1 Tax=Oxynema sp. CENA135 TaxID=984206 RepID=UPI000F1F1C0F|nr:DUF4157 domain-containing protein [Oxynema sp. CENA135]MBK4728874.1 DUF4157 domain-containing protein [Oxynema sp. CENA135]RMH78230.1 MAG: DUF4157 domain-containing protein [Cyanobacteria bacterium J007]